MRWQVAMAVLAIIAIGSMYGFARSPGFETTRSTDVLLLFSAGFSLGILTAVAGSAARR